MSTPKASLAARRPEDLVALRDEIAMRTLQSLIADGTWGKKDDEGVHRRFKSVDELSFAAYEFADAMLEARERV